MQAHSFLSGALSFSNHFCCIGCEGTWLCIVSLMSQLLALITVFLESLGSLHIFAVLGSILLVVGSRKRMVHAFLISILPLVIGLVLLFITKMGCL